jgi:MFS transporter, Spinster family, sphingosine-1-phosphate transporter
VSNDISIRNRIAPGKSLWLKPEWTLLGFLWVCYVLNHADRQVVYTLFPALQKEFGFSNTVLGLTGALFLWVYGFCSPAAGILGDRLSKTKLIVGSLAVWSSLTLLSGLSPNGIFLLSCRALLGVSESLFMPAAYALIANAHGPATRSKAIAIFGTSQLFGVALGGSGSGFIAELLNWRVSFWLLGLAGLLFALPLAQFLRSLPDHFHHGSDTRKEPATVGSFIRLLRIPSLRIVTAFVASATFGLFLVYTWLPTFLYDKFSLGLARAGFEASVYPQIGTLGGLFVGSVLADRYYLRVKAARFWVLFVAFAAAGPGILLIGTSQSLDATRLAGVAFGFFSGFINGNQAAAAFDVVPASLRASTVGVLNMVGAAIAGFAPFLGGMARSTIGVDQLFIYTSALYLANAFLIVYVIRRHFYRDHRLAQEL